MCTYFEAKKKKDERDSTSTVAANLNPKLHYFHSSISSSPLSCAGAYNGAFSGKKKAVVSIYYTIDLTTVLCWQIQRNGVLNGLDGGMVCVTCKKLCLEKGSSDPVTVMNRWAPPLHHCEETDSDFSDTKRFAKIAEQQLTPAGMDLKI
jgi:hypothetical protein